VSRSLRCSPFVTSESIPSGPSPAEFEPLTRKVHAVAGGGVGSTSFAGDERFTVNVGAGARILLQDGLALRLDVRDRILAVDVFGEDKRTHNFEAALSFTGFF